MTYHRHRRTRYRGGRQHIRRPPRACRAFSLLLWRIRSGLTTERDVGRVIRERAWRCFWEGYGVGADICIKNLEAEIERLHAEKEADDE